MCRSSGVLFALVDHVLDEEQSPSARCLQPRQLQLEVGRVGDGVLAPPPEVADLDGDARAVAATTTSTGSSARLWLPCSMAFIAASADAVLSARAGRGRARVGDDLGHPRQDVPLVARSRWGPRTGREIVARPAGRRRGVSQRHERDVVLLLLAAGEALQQRDAGVNEGGADVGRATSSWVRSKPNISPSSLCCSVMPSL